MAKKKKATKPALKGDVDAEFDEITRQFRSLGIEDPGVSTGLVKLALKLWLIQAGIDEILKGQDELRKMLDDLAPAPSDASLRKRK